MDHTHNLEVRLAHPVDVSSAAKYLLQRLGCDNWYVACHHEHLFVFRLTQGPADRFAVRFECTTPVEKGIYHNSKAWSVSITPLHNERDLDADTISMIRIGLAELGSDPHGTS